MPLSPEEKALNHKLGVLNTATEYVDADVHQTAQFDYMHAMRPSGETVDQAMAKSDEFVRKQFENAKQLLKEGKTDIAYFVFGIGLHTLQDATSPAHGGFQLWTGKESFVKEAIHVAKEFSYSGTQSNLQRITIQYLNWFEHSNDPLPKENLFKFRQCICKSCIRCKSTILI